MTKGIHKIKVMYAKIDRIIYGKLEIRVNRQSKREKHFLPRINKIEDIQINTEDDNDYNIWRKDKKGKKGGVMIIIKSRIKMVYVEFSKEKGEPTSAQIIVYGEMQKIVVA